MKRIIFIIVFFLSVNFIFVVKSQTDDCTIFNIGIEKLVNVFRTDTLVLVLNRTNNYNLESLKSMLIKDLNSYNKDTLVIPHSNAFYISEDSILNCQSKSNNFNLINGYPTYFENENYVGKFPPFIISSNILYFENKYAYLRFSVYEKTMGNATIWFILKKDCYNNWSDVKIGIYV